MRIGTKQAKYTIKVFDNYTKKTKSFVVSDLEDIENNIELANLLKKLLTEYYKSNGKK